MPFPVPIPSSWVFVRPLLLLLSLFLLTVAFVRAQEYSYIHYDAKDGLAGTVVYSMCQDKEGFIWFGTETGVSRFDGTHFKNFTVNDGLPDNTIIRVYADAMGRVWLVPFKHTICYYYKGKIYNQQNDPLLKQIKLDYFVVGIWENKHRDILLKGDTSVFLVTAGDKVTSLTSDTIKRAYSIGVSNTGNYYVLYRDRVYSYDQKAFRFISQLNPGLAGTGHVILHDQFFCALESYSQVRIRSALYKLNYTYQVPPLSNVYRVNDSVICLNTTRGAIFLNILRRRPEHHFLPGKNISNILTDREGGIWFSTFNDGAYRLSSKEFKNIKKEINGGQKLSVYDLQSYHGAILAGSDMGYVQVIRHDSVQLIALGQQLNIPQSTVVSSIRKRGDLLVVGCGAFIFFARSLSGFRHSRAASSTKEVAFKDDSTLVVASGHYLYASPLPAMDTAHHLWTGRTTSLLLHKDVVYFGTLNGLYQLNPDTTVLYLGDIHPVLQNRVASIREGTDGIVWVATYGAGIIGLKNNRIVRQITKADGLSSSICRCLAVDSGCVWVGTDKGLNKVDLSANPAGIVKYSTADGLASDIINTVLITGDTVYVGTPEGITYFDETKVAAFSQCDLKMLAVYVNGQETPYEYSFNLRHTDNNIRFEYAGISFKAAGDIVYTYRLKGWDTAWKTTTQTSLEFISLPPGQYTLELSATNKFGIKSDLLTTAITVEAPFWRTSWFVVLCAGVAAFVTWFVVNSRNKSSRKKEAAARAFEQRLQELEQKALRAQMNPHFIFNCLNSVQEFMLDNDALNANKYLSNFARLIRQTLDNSLQPLISVADEVRYLTTYLDLEEMRFKNNFRYSIQIDARIAPSQTFIPGMLLQPYVENAIRHGIQYKEGQQGQIEITLSLEHELLICTILDNGVGREAAQVFKTEQHIEYQSRGMQLTQERIDMLNKNLDPKIVVEVIDCMAADGTAAGTKIMICFPLLQPKEPTATI